MGFWQTLTGRTKPVEAEAGRPVRPAGGGGDAARRRGLQADRRGLRLLPGAEGAAFATTQRDVVALLDEDGDPDVEVTTDEYGYTWLLARQTTTWARSSPTCTR